MITASRYRQPARRGDRLLAIILVALVHVGLGLALIGGLTVRLVPGADSPLDLVELNVPPPPPPPAPPPLAPARSGSAAAKASPSPKGGVEAPSPVKKFAPVQPSPIIVLPLPTIVVAGGTEGRGGPSAGAGAGGGSGGDGDGSGSGEGSGEGDGGTELEQIAGSIRPSDYPRQLRNRGIGGLVQMRFTVAPNGRVSRCVITGSSGVSDLDELTCRLIQQRFVFRPSTDRSGRAIASDVEGEHQWTSRPGRE